MLDEVRVRDKEVGAAKKGCGKVRGVKHKSPSSSLESSLPSALTGANLPPEPEVPIEFAADRRRDFLPDELSVEVVPVEPPIEVLPLMAKPIGKGLAKLAASSADGFIGEDYTLHSHHLFHVGYLTVLEAPNAGKSQLDIWGYTGNTLELMKRFQQQFDPQKVFSPGRFVG